MPSVKLYLKKAKHNGQLRKDEVSIIAKFSLGRSFRFEVNTGEKIIPSFWNFTQQKAKSTFRRHLELNDSLEDFKREIRELYKKNTANLPEFKKLCQSRFKGSPLPQEKKTLFIAFEKFLSAYKAEKDKKTVAKYETLLARLTDFDKVYPIDLPTLDFNFHDAFKKFLYTIPNPFYPNQSLVYDMADDSWRITEGSEGDPVGIFDETVNAYFIQLKTFLAWAEQREPSVHKSYKSWKTIRHAHDPITLTSAELETIENAVFKSEALNIGRDFLLFECHTGQRISDLKRFDLKNLTGNKWTFTPRKGNRLSPKQNTVHLNERAIGILQKYNWKMPVLSEQKINKNIHKACKAAGIDRPTIIYRWAGNRRIKIEGPKYEFITSHTGRKTWITLALQSGMSAEHVMELTGIRDYKTLKHYRGKFEEEAVKKELEKIPLMRKVL